MRQADTTFPKRYCAIPSLNVTLSPIGWFESASVNGHRAFVSRYGVNKNQKLGKFLQIHNIWHRNLLDITTDVNSIMKVKKYRFHMSISHIFWELHCAELPECIAVSKLPGLDPVSGSAMEAPECLPDVHEGPPNLVESNADGFS
jgi:hypothetical protein